MSEVVVRDPDGRGPRPLVVVLVGIAASTIVAVAAFGLLAPRETEGDGQVPTAPSTGDAADPSAPPVSTPAAADPVQIVAIEEAALAAESLVTATNSMLALGDGTVPDISAVAGGFVAGEVQALAAERAALGFRQVGEAVVTRVTASSIDLTVEPKQMLLEVCIDASGIDVVDENGASLGAAVYNPGTPVLHHYGAQLLDGSWKLITHEIPTNGQCS